MMWLKGCPKCSGDMVAEEDEYTAYVKCLQCGRILSAAEEERLKALSTAARTGAYKGGLTAVPNARRAA